MAKESSDPWKRMREREDEAAEAQSTQDLTAKNVAQAGSEKLHMLLDQAEPMIEQLNNLYNQYISGVERMPPLERRKQLDQLMTGITMVSKPTQALRFRCNTVHSQYMTHKDRWDRLLKQLEDGKIKRTAGPRKGQGGK